MFETDPGQPSAIPGGRGARKVDQKLELTKSMSFLFTLTCSQQRKLALLCLKQILASPVLSRVGAAHGKSTEEVALRWALQVTLHDIVIANIVWCILQKGGGGHYSAR